jgi:hypothetical protein
MFETSQFLRNQLLETRRATTNQFLVRFLKNNRFPVSKIPRNWANLANANIFFTNGVWPLTSDLKNELQVLRNRNTTT